MNAFPCTKNRQPQNRDVQNTAGSGRIAGLDQIPEPQHQSDAEGIYRGYAIVYYGRQHGTQVEYYSKITCVIAIKQIHTIQSRMSAVKIGDALISCDSNQASKIKLSVIRSDWPAAKVLL